MNWNILVSDTVSHMWMSFIYKIGDAFQKFIFMFRKHWLVLFKNTTCIKLNDSDTSHMEE